MNTSVLIEQLRRRPEILCAYLFGSAAQEKAMHPESDIDLALLVSPAVPQEKYWDYRSDLAMDLGEKMPRELDLILLNDASPFLKYQILATGKLIYDASRKARQNFVVSSLMEYYDFLPIKEIVERKALTRLWAR